MPRRQWEISAVPHPCAIDRTALSGIRNKEDFHLDTIKDTNYAPLRLTSRRKSYASPNAYGRITEEIVLLPPGKGQKQICWYGLNGQLLSFAEVCVIVRLGVLEIFFALVAGLLSQAQVTAQVTWTYNSSATNPCPLPKECDAWRAFRAVHPSPYQAFAVGDSKDESVVIISEPPPSLSREQLDQALRGLFGDNLLQLSRFHWPTGVDGWLEDVVIRVRSSGDEREQVFSGKGFEAWQAPSWIVARLRLLHQMFFHTADGFWVDRPGDAPSGLPISDLSIGVSDLAAWVNPDESWQSISGDQVRKTRQLYAEAAPGVYYSGNGLIVLVIPNSAHLVELAPCFRRFAVASDLVVGASGLKHGGMLLFARQRQLDFATLPPLRFESLAAFAKAPAEHLAQSYERQRIFAGRVRNGEFAGWDWAPILLSPQLDDTEAGTLLNLADQILKSWSEHGSVEYYAFPYPKPPNYPFGEEAASEYFENKYLTTSLVFNWNTSGVATITTVNGADLLTGDRTGALTILYRPSNSVSEQKTGRRIDVPAMRRDADERAQNARNYFATMGDPILVRVVQHVMLFQSVQSFLNAADPKVTPKRSRSDVVAGVLTERATAWLKQIADGGPDVDPTLRAALQEFTTSSRMTPEQLARFIAFPQAIESDYQRAVQRYRTSYVNYKYAKDHLPEEEGRAHEIFVNTCNSVGGNYTLIGERGKCSWPQVMGDNTELVFASYFAYSKAVEKMQADYNLSVATLEKQSAALDNLEETYAQTAEFSKRLSRGSSSVDRDEVLHVILQATAGQVTSSSIRTPSIVLSKNTTETDFVGGHNIDLVPQRRVVAPRFRTEPAIDGDAKPVFGTKPPTKIQLMPADLGPARPAKEALEVRKSGNLLDELRHSAIKAEQSASSAWTEIELKAKSCECDVLVVNGEDGNIYSIRNAPPPAKQIVFGKSGIVDVIAEPPPSKTVRFEGFQESTVDNIARTTALVRDGEAAGPKGALETLTDFFKPAERRPGEVSYTVEREVSGQQERLILSHDAGSEISSAERLSWRTSTVTDVSPARWSELFGDEGRLTSSSSEALIVRFQSAQTTQARWLGIRVQATGAERAGIVARLRGVVERWRGSQPITPRRLDESLISLRAAIRKQLKPIDLEFYYKNNRGKIRAAELFVGTRCSHEGCGG